jgi:putative tryptophan/tyrosine transport system substrate-binding protein
MRRREFLTGLLTTTTASALRAEPNRIYRLAVCFFRPQVGTPMLDRLRQLGYVEGKNLIVNRYVPEGHDFAEIARNMVQTHPDVIVLGADNRLISQIANAAPAIPIVAVIPSLAAGHVRNAARPEGNITGIAADAGIEMQGKQLGILREAVPSVTRVAYLSNRDDWEGTWGRAVRKAGEASGVAIIGIPMEHSAEEPEYRRAFETMVQQSVQALIFNGLPPNNSHREIISELAFKNRLPSICWWLDIVENSHGFLSYAPDYSDLPERLADLVGQVLKGTKIADIPVQQPTKFILAINLKTARAFGLQIPPTLLALADKVIE